MSITLRSYQEAAVAEVVARRRSAPILVAPTGSGKTIMGVEVARRLGGGVLWVAHRRELVKQAQDAVVAAGGAGRIRVRSIQSMAQNPAWRSDVLIIDECHHATAPTYKRLIDTHRVRVGLTATPFRLDGAGLGDAGFRSIVVAANVADLCRDGYLVEPEVYTAAPPRLEGVKHERGDFNSADLERRIDTPSLVADVVDTWERRAIGRRTVCFAVSVAHAEHLAARWRERGHAVAVVSGLTPKVQRDDTLAALSSGDLAVVVNCQLLTEGWDLPALEVASIARPTESLNLYLQMVGRVMRAANGKRATILDHAGNHLRHGPVTQEIGYSLSGKVVVSYSRSNPHAAAREAAEQDPIPTEAEGELELATKINSTPRVPRHKIDQETGQCRECGKFFRCRAAYAYYCGSCKWKREKARGQSNCRTAEFECPTCGSKFHRSFQVAKRAKNGKPIYCSFQCNPSHPAFRPTLPPPEAPRG